MTAPDEQDELRTLSRARAALSPLPADAVRVRHALTAALAAPPIGAPDAGAAADGVGLAASWPLRILVTSVAAAAVGAGGYWLGHGAGVREGRLAVSPPALEAASAAPPETPAAAGAVAPVAWPSPPAAPGAPVEEPSAARGGKSRRLATGARTPRPDPTVTAAESLEQEVRALRAVERALRDNQPRLALAILQQLDRAVPTGRLVEERRATSIIARCSAGDVPFDVNLAEHFAGDYPESVYLGRVQQSCAPPPRASGGGK